MSFRIGILRHCILIATALKKKFHFMKPGFNNMTKHRNQWQLCLLRVFTEHFKHSCISELRYTMTLKIITFILFRILWMVPIYAVNAWLGLEFPEQSIYMDSMRECYEAYVIYNFMKFLLNYLNEDVDLETSLENKPQVNHMFPLCCLTPWEMGR